MKLPTPCGFSLIRTVYSHGWFDLPPFGWSEEKGTLKRIVRTGTGRLLFVTVREPEPGRLNVKVRRPEGAATVAEKKEALAQVSRMLRLDEAMDSFYGLCDSTPGYQWIAGAGAGRLLRAPDPFEDLVKLICTTNCSWSLTRKMIEGLVEGLGEEVPPAPFRSFPTPEAMAGAGLDFYRNRVRAGYRAPHLRAIARMVAEGGLEPAGWLDPGRPSEEIAAEIRALPGAGRYVAENMLKLLGRYEGLGLDSWCRRKFSEIHRDGGAVTDDEIASHYERFGPWRGLALWCDLTRDWCEGEAPGAEALRLQKY